MQPQTKGDLIKNTHTLAGAHTHWKKQHPSSLKFTITHMETNSRRGVLWWAKARGWWDGAAWFCWGGVCECVWMLHYWHTSCFFAMIKTNKQTWLIFGAHLSPDRWVYTITSNSSSSWIKKPSSSRDQTKDWCAGRLSSPAVMSSVILRKELRCNA